MHQPSPGLAWGLLSECICYLFPSLALGLRRGSARYSQSDLVKLLDLSRLLGFSPVKWRYNSAKIMASQWHHVVLFYTITFHGRNSVIHILPSFRYDRTLTFYSASIRRNHLFYLLFYSLISSFIRTGGWRHVFSLDHAHALLQAQGLFGLTCTGAIFNVDSKGKLRCCPFR